MVEYPWNRPALHVLDRAVDTDDRRSSRVHGHGNLLHVILGFPIRRYRAVFRNRSWTRVVRRERQLDVLRILRQQAFQVGHARADVFGRVVGVTHAVLLRGSRHQLHEAHRALHRCRRRVVGGLRLDDRLHEVLVHAIRAGMLLDQCVESRRAAARQGTRRSDRSGRAHRERLCGGVLRLVGQHVVSRGIPPHVDLGLRHGWGRGDEHEGAQNDPAQAS